MRCVPVSVFEVSGVSEADGADLTQEALRVPVGVHRLDHTTNDEVICNGNNLCHMVSIDMHNLVDVDSMDYNNTVHLRNLIGNIISLENVSVPLFIIFF